MYSTLVVRVRRQLPHFYARELVRRLTRQIAFGRLNRGGDSWIESALRAEQERFDNASKAHIQTLRSDRGLNRIRDPVCLFVDHFKLAPFNE